MRWLVPLLVLAWVSTAAWSDPAPNWSGGGIVWNDAVYKLNYAVAVDETTWGYKWWVTFNGYTVTDPGYFTDFVVYDPTTGLTYTSAWSSVTDVDNDPLNESWGTSSQDGKVAIEWKKGSGAPNAGVGTVGDFGADFNRKIAWEDPVNIGTLMSAIHVQGLTSLPGINSLWIHSGNVDPRPPQPPDIVPEPSLGLLLLVSAVPLLGLWRRRRRV